MKKLDIFVLKAFFSSFFYILFIIIFLLLLQQLLPYLEDLVGKNVNYFEYLRLIFYFAVVMVPLALPITIMMSSLIAFGNMGEHFELTALKCSGISLVRILRPVFIFSIITVFLAYYSNNYIIPKATLQAYSTIYNIKNTNPAFELQEGVFYNGLPGFSIKVKKKYPDGKSLRDLYIYDHTQKNGNTNVILADSAQMYFIRNKRYLLMKLYNGNQYAVANAKSNLTQKKDYKYTEIEPFVRQKFDSTVLVFSLKSFDQLNIEARAFSSHRIMKNAFELIEMKKRANAHVLEDQMNSEKVIADYYKFNSLRARAKKGENLIKNFIFYDSLRILNDSIADFKHLVKTFKAQWLEKDFKSSDSNDSLNIHITQQMVLDSFGTEIQTRLHENLISRRKNLAQRMDIIAQPLKWYEKNYNNYLLQDSSFLINTYEDILKNTESDMIVKRNSLQNQKRKVRELKHHFKRVAKIHDKNRKEIIRIELEFHKKMALAVACVAMFLIGGPLGAIVKKGGLGFPVIIAVFFFVIFYIIGTNGEKLAREGIIEPWGGAWAPVYVLLPFGFWFVKKSKDDARLFEIENYMMIFAILKRKIIYLISRRK